MKHARLEQLLPDTLLDTESEKRAFNASNNPITSRECAPLAGILHHK